MIIKHLLAHSKLWFTLALLWTIAVAFLCLVSIKQLPSLGISGFDKYVHFTFHFIFTGLWMFYVNAKKIIETKSIIKVVVASIIFGIIIEILQEIFTTTRKADIRDVGANLTGAVVASMILYSFFKMTNKQNTV